MYGRNNNGYGSQQTGSQQTGYSSGYSSNSQAGGYNPSSVNYQSGYYPPTTSTVNYQQTGCASSHGMFGGHHNHHHSHVCHDHCGCHHHTHSIFDEIQHDIDAALNPCHHHHGCK